MAKSVIETSADEILELLPRVPRHTVLKTINRVWQHFCRRAMVWSTDIAFDRTAGEYQYTVTVKEQATVKQVDGVFFRTAENVAANERGQALPRNLYQAAINDKGQLVITLRVRPSDTLASGYAVRVVLVPERNADVANEQLFTLYEEGIIGGVVADLASRPSRPWTNYPLAAERRTEFFRAISRGLSVRAKGLTEPNGVLQSS